MSHEIYYTSAPEGLKPGTSGFCTVAASTDIPRALWDRLESLSAYRHQFGVSHGGGGGGGGGGQADQSEQIDGQDQSVGATGPNPVSQAHWILSIAGKNYHVLSRVCDSGVDHTQRTNAFAHHLVLEPGEMDAARGGPAWMLEQSGVMADSWNGQVGELPRRDLPRGDLYTPSRVCREWERATGDAGWGGHLIDVFLKTPTRPVCLIFAPGMSVIPLITEALALLPAAARWNVTFNTYFTSMPTSATCLWRCCLAGTPAAQIGRRYASGGIIIDLTDRGRIGTAPDGPYATMARSGQAEPETIAPARSVASGSRSSVESSMPLSGEKSRSVPAPTEEELDFAVPAPSRPAPRASPFADLNSRRSIGDADDELLNAEALAGRIAQRRRKQVLMLFLGALGAIAIGTGLVVWAYHSNAPPPDTLMLPSTRISPAIANVTPGRTPDFTPTIPATETTTAVASEDHLPPPKTPPEQVAPAPVSPAATFPSVITLASPIERPAVGSGIGDRTQSLALHAADLDATANAMRIHFPPQPASAPPPANAYQTEVSGSLSATSESRSGKPGVTIKWKSNGDIAPPAEVLFIGFDRTKPALDLTWRSSALLKKPEMLGFTYWVLQQSTLELAGPGKDKGQNIAFKTFDPPALIFTEASQTIPWPVELPRDASAIAPTTLPEGWQAAWYTDWEVKDPAQRTPENALQVIKFRKPTTTAAIDAWFLVTLRPGLMKVESTFNRRLQDAQNEQAKAENDLRAILAQIDDATKLSGGTLPNIPSVQALLARKLETQRLIDAYKSAISSYNSLTRFDVSFDLPDGLRLATVHFKASARIDEAGK